MEVMINAYGDQSSVYMMSKWSVLCTLCICCRALLLDVILYAINFLYESDLHEAMKC